MEAQKTFRQLVKKTCYKIFWQFILAVLVLYLAPLAFVEIDLSSQGLNAYSESIFGNVLSWVYICLALLVIMAFNIGRMLRLIKREMDIVYHKSMWLEPSPSKGDLSLVEFNQTEQKIDKMQKKIKKMLEDERQQKEDLAFGVSALSHDIKTPLTIISGNCELLDSSSLDQDQRAYLTDINQAQDKLANYFTNLLNYSKTYYDQGGERATYSFSELIEAVYQEASFIAKPYADLVFKNLVEKDYQLSLNLNYILRALSNIINNSIDHSKASEKKIVMKVYQEGEEIVFSVWNNGSNFSAEAIENSGKLFYTNNKSRNLKDNHYGIGLAFSSRVADLHGGVLVLSNSSGGAQVNLSLKIEKVY